jgi:hypothetical protein
MRKKSALGTLAAAAALLMLATLTACKPDNIAFEIGNKSGATIHDVKLTFPGDDLTFRTLEDSTDAATFRHFSGPGELAISYSTDDGHTYNFSGPQVTGKEKGQVKVMIDGRYASFDTQFEDNQRQQ